VYWPARYLEGGNSGVGSRGRLAQFKADVVNQVVRDFDISTLLEFGCGDGYQASLIDVKQYLGVDISSKALDAARARAIGRPGRVFHNLCDIQNALEPADATMSLDVIYHLIEDDVYEAHMRQLFKFARCTVIIYSSNNVPLPHLSPVHIKHRAFTKWINNNEPDWYLEKCIPNAFPANPEDPDNTSMADFYIYRRLTNKFNHGSQK